MRLLIVEHKTVWGGGQVMLVNLLEAWRRAGERIEPTLVCPPDAALAARARQMGFECVTMPLGEIEKTRGAAWNLAQRAVPTRALRQTMRRTQTEVVLANSAFSFLASVFAAKLARRPIVWWEHNATLPGDGVVRRMIRHADRIAVVSAEIRAQFVALDPTAASKITVIHNGVDGEKFCPSHELRGEIRRTLGWDDSVRVVGTVGRLAPEKGTEYFVQAANEIARADAGARFLIVGDGPERAALEALANPDVVRFVGKRDDVAAWLNAMDVFVLSSLADAFPLSVLEAMACRLPVIASNVGGLPEIVVDGKTGLLVPPRDVGALARAMASLLGDPERGRALGAAGRIRVEQFFLLEQTARKMREVLVDAMGVG